MQTVVKTAIVLVGSVALTLLGFHNWDKFQGPITVLTPLVAFLIADVFQGVTARKKVNVKVSFWMSKNMTSVNALSEYLSEDLNVLTNMLQAQGAPGQPPLITKRHAMPWPTLSEFPDQIDEISSKTLLAAQGINGFVFLVNTCREQYLVLRKQMLELAESTRTASEQELPRYSLKLRVTMVGMQAAIENTRDMIGGLNDAMSSLGKPVRSITQQK